LLGSRAPSIFSLLQNRLPGVKNCLGSVKVVGISLNPPEKCTLALGAPQPCTEVVHKSTHNLTTRSAMVTGNTNTTKLNQTIESHCMRTQASRPSLVPFMGHGPPHRSRLASRAPKRTSSAQPKAVVKAVMPFWWSHHDELPTIHATRLNSNIDSNMVFKHALGSSSCLYHRFRDTHLWSTPSHKSDNSCHQVHHNITNVTKLSANAFASCICVNRLSSKHGLG